MPSTFTPGIVPQATSGPALWFLFQKSRLLVRQMSDDHVDVPLLTTPEDLDLSPISSSYLGYVQNPDGYTNCFAGELNEAAEAPPNFAFKNLRPLYSQLDERAFWLAGRARQIVDWARTSRYCGHCGREMTAQTNDRSKICPNCELTSYPVLAPAVIVRIQRNTPTGPEILLARATRFPTSMFSVLAGFVEPGETLEECVEREIFEEVSLTVKNITYFGSQPWPFPHSLMIGFTAEYEAGEVVIDPRELAEAAWFSADAMPGIPPPPSIANRLIKSWLETLSTTG